MSSTIQTTPVAGLVSAKTYRKQAGISDTTLWRWARAGHFHPVNIAGRQYLRREEIASFEMRAALGHFARTPTGAARAKQTEAAA